MPRRRRPPRAGAVTELPPLRILGQMAALQALYYTVAMVLMLFTSLVAGRAFALELVFGWDAVRGDTAQGWLIAFVWLLVGGVFMSLALVLIVVRSKLVPDFALTIHFLHLVVVFLVTGKLPRHMMWWLTMAVSGALAVGLGAWGCRYRELQPISFGGGGGAGAAGVAEGSSGGGEEGVVGDEEQGYARGRGRGRGKDGGGDYEMVRMAQMNGSADRRED